MKKPKFKLVDDLSVANWVKESLYPWDEHDYSKLGTDIPDCYELYLSIRNKVKATAEEWYPSFNHEKLVVKLMDYTETPDHCFYGMWNGFGIDYEEEREYLFKGKERKFDSWSGKYWFTNLLKLENRDYYLFEGTLIDSLNIVDFSWMYHVNEYVNLMWPLDRSWFLAKEIDYEVTFIGGSKELIDELENSGLYQTERFDPKDPNQKIFLVNL
jgi:hypothetical protein